MPISKINTTSITDNSVTAGKIVAGAVDADIAAGSIDTAQIADDAVTADKLANAINTSIAAKAPIASPVFTGNVGIGNASPGQELDISSTNPAVRLTDINTSGLYHDLVSYGNDLRFSADGGGVEADTNIEFYIDNAEKMRITSDGHVGIGTTPATTFHAKRDNDNQLTATIENNGSATTGRHVLKLISSGTGSGTKLLELQSAGGSTTRLEVLADGRGLSQFTAKAWVNYNGVAASINDSHNVSSVTDNAVGRYTINFSVAMGNTNYAVTTHVEDGGGYNDGRWLNHESSQSRTTSAYGLYCLHSNGALDDATGLSAVFFGD
jgi:hypothetical protein